MELVFDGRQSDSPLVEMIWRTQSERAGTFISQAETRSEIVVTKYQGQTSLTFRGPETKATSADYPPDAEFFGIVLKLGTYMPHLPPTHLLDRKDMTLPEATSQSFWLLGMAWQIPTFENADTFVDRLVRQSLLVREPVVEAALQGHLKDLSLRSIQRRFLRSTGVTHNTVYQIERARRALALLQQGVSIFDTVYEAGYADQPHLTRSLKRYLGQTPSQIARVSFAGNEG
jgi:AraC-like DNA-binding protein